MRRVQKRIGGGRCNSAMRHGRSTGERLADSGVAVMRHGSAPIARAEVQGFFVVSASSMDDAVAVARSSPHVQSGGTIIVRPIDTP